MEQPDFFAIPSPCIGVCTANSKGYCKGCLRSREERLHWQSMSDTQKHQVMRLLALRRSKVQQHRLALAHGQTDNETMEAEEGQLALF